MWTHQQLCQLAGIGNNGNLAFLLGILAGITRFVLVQRQNPACIGWAAYEGITFLLPAKTLTH